MERYDKSRALRIFATGEDPRRIVELVDADLRRFPAVRVPDLTDDRASELVGDVHHRPHQVRGDLLGHEKGLDPLLGEQTSGGGGRLDWRVDGAGPLRVGGRGPVEHRAARIDPGRGYFVPRGTIAQRDDGILIQSREANGRHAVLEVPPHVRIEGRVVVEVEQARDQRPARSVDHSRAGRCLERTTRSRVVNAITLDQYDTISHGRGTGAVDEGRALDGERAGLRCHGDCPPGSTLGNPSGPDNPSSVSTRSREESSLPDSRTVAKSHRVLHRCHAVSGRFAARWREARPTPAEVPPARTGKASDPAMEGLDIPGAGSPEAPASRV